MKKKGFIGVVLVLCVVGFVQLAAAELPDSAFKLAGQLSAEDLAALKQIAEENLVKRMAENRTPADTCDSATNEIGALPFNVAGTTVGMTDDYDLDVNVPSGCALGGNSWTGTGVAPDIGYRIQTDIACDLTVTVTPEAAYDTALVIYNPQCSNLESDCVIVSDEGFPGDPETVVFNASAGVDYFILVDGYSSGGVPPGPSGTFTLDIGGTSCVLVPVELQSFDVQ